MNAKLGSNPSYLWRSLLEGRSLLQRGMVWRVGDGSNIQVWDDPWLPCPPSFRVSQCSRTLWLDARVCDLIDAHSSDWRLDLLHTLFLSYEVQII